MLCYPSCAILDLSGRFYLWLEAASEHIWCFQFMMHIWLIGTGWFVFKGFQGSAHTHTHTHTQRTHTHTYYTQTHIHRGRCFGPDGRHLLYHLACCWCSAACAPIILSALKAGERQMCLGGCPRLQMCRCGALCLLPFFWATRDACATSTSSSSSLGQSRPTAGKA